MKSDYELFLKECGLTAEQVERARRDVPYTAFDWRSELVGLYLGDSLIEGTGVYTEQPLPHGISLGAAYLESTWTALGRFMNHSPDPNTRPVAFEGGLLFVTIKDIGPDEELTCNYRDVKEIIQMEAEVETFVNRNG